MHGVHCFSGRALHVNASVEPFWGIHVLHVLVSQNDSIKFSAYHFTYPDMVTEKTTDLSLCMHTSHGPMQAKGWKTPGYYN